MINLQKGVQPSKKSIYLVIWDNGQEYDHDYNVIGAFYSDDEAQRFRIKWDDEYQRSQDDIAAQFPDYSSRHSVYIQEIEII